MEVIYTGLRQSPEQIVNAALQEDADVIGLSILSGAHNHICPRVTQLLKKKGLDDVLVIVGGIIPDLDVPHLRRDRDRGDLSARQFDDRHHCLCQGPRQATPLNCSSVLTYRPWRGSLDQSHGDQTPPCR